MRRYIDRDKLLLRLMSFPGNTAAICIVKQMGVYRKTDIVKGRRKDICKKKRK